MNRVPLDDLSAFATVARARSFTRAAVELGVSTPALSYQIKRLEQKLGARLLNRNSRGVATTEDGETLMQSLSPALRDIGDAIEELQRRRKGVTGALRITVTRQAYEAVIRPVLQEFAAAYPLARIEAFIDYGFRDLVADRLDAGIRIGEKLDPAMIAVSVGPQLRMAIVGSPDYFSNRQVPRTPQDLAEHRCINYRMQAGGVLMPWQFERDGRTLDVQVEGPLTVNEPEVALGAALDGLGLAYVMEDRAAHHLANGRLVRLLSEWTPAFPGFFLYYPTRRQIRPVLVALIAMLRRRRGDAIAREP